MRQKRVTVSLLVSVTTLLLFTHAPLAFAVEGASIGISPAYPVADNERSTSIFIHTISPGESAKDGVRVFNYTKKVRTVEIRAVDSVAAVDGSFSCRQDSEKRQQVGAWTTLKTQQITLQPESSEVVDFTISLPKGISPGEHGGCVTAQDKDSFAGSGGSGIQLGFRSAIRIAVTVPGDIVKSLSIARIDISRTKEGNYTVSPIAKNKGNVSLDVTTRAQLVDILGRETPIQTAKYPIMAGSSMGWGFTFDGPYWGGVYKARTSISYNANPNDGIGVNQGNLKKTRLDSDYFVAIPALPAALVELAVPAFIIYLIIALVLRRRNKKKIRTKWQQYTVRSGDSVVSLGTEYKTKWKQIAKINSLKPPYLLTEGQQILLPVTKQSDDWLLDKTPNHTQLTEAVEAPVVNTRPERVSSLEVASVANHQPEITKPVQSSSGAPARGAWIAAIQSDQSDSAAFDEFGEPIPDWRDGADSEEIEKIEHIDGAMFAAQYKNVWAEDEEKPAKPSTKRSSSAPKKRKTVSSSKAKGPKKTSKKAK